MIVTIIEKLIKHELLTDDEKAYLLDWFSRMAAAPALIEGIFKGTTSIIQASDISNNAGLFEAGEFRSGNGRAPGDGFTGGRFGWPGFTYDGSDYFLAGVDNDRLQVGLSLDDGKVYAGGGNIVIDTNGITDVSGISGLRSKSASTYTIVGKVWYGINNGAPYSIDGFHSFHFVSDTERFTDDFEDGTLNKWSLTGSPSIETASPLNGRYFARITDTNKISKTLSATVLGASNYYFVTCVFRGSGVILDYGGAAPITLAESYFQPDVWYRAYFVFQAVSDTTPTITLYSISGNLDIDDVYVHEMQETGLPFSIGVISSGVGRATGAISFLKNISINGSQTIYPSFVLDTVDVLMYWDSVNRRVGIRNSAPTEVLDVTGNIKASGTITGTNTTDEYMQDVIGAMVTGNTETGITVTYDDSGAKLNFVTDVTTSSIREKLTAARTYYVRTDGSDSNTGLVNSAGGAFLTIQKAIDTVNTLDLSIYNVTIQVADGTYTGATTITGLWLGSGTVTIVGNVATPANVVISTTSASCFTVTGGAIYIESLKMQTTTSGSCILAQNFGFASVSNVNFGAAANRHMHGSNLGVIAAHGDYTISGNAQAHWRTEGFSEIRVQSRTITLTGTPAFSTSFCQTILDSLALVNANTFSGSGTGPRYIVTGNSVIQTNNGSESYLPGNSAGTRSTGGVYNTSAEVLGTIRNSAQFDKANTTLAAITGLSATLLAGRTYKFRIVLYTTSNVASGVKIDLNGGTATATSIIAEGSILQAGALVAPGTGRVTALATTFCNVTAVTAATIIVEGTITVNAAGTFIPEFADNAGTNTSSVLVGSSLQVEDIT